MVGTDAAFINRTIGSVYTDLGYLVDVGVISDAVYEEITAKIPRRYKPSDATSSLPDVGQLQVTSNNAATKAPSPMPLQNSTANVRPVPQAPVPSPAPPAYRGVGQAEALYDYSGSDENDLPFRVGDKILILEYINSDWWKGEANGKDGLFPSNYVKKTSDQGQILEKVPYEQVKQYPSLAPGQYNPQQYQPVQYAVAPANQQVAYAQTGVQPQQQQPITVVQDKKSGKLHSIGGKLGNAAIFGAGATIGGNIVNAIF